MEISISQPGIPPQHKRCATCKEIFPLEYFGKDARAKDGFRRDCKDCRREEKKRALERNPDLYKQYHQKLIRDPEKYEQHKEYQAKYKRDYRKKKKTEGICTQCTTNPAVDGHYCDKCREYHHKKRLEYRDKWPQYGKDERDRLRQAVLDAYGNKCACCGETQQEFLAIDHMNNDGAKHRREINHKSMYRWLRENGFPPDFQILCHNCNYAKFRYAVCPHQRKPPELNA